MTVIFQTDLDHYEPHWFPQNLSIPPRVGEWVSCRGVVTEVCKEKRIPVILQVESVTWTANRAICKLWYRDIDRPYYAPDC